jgi:hypothetical protein
MTRNDARKQGELGLAGTVEDDAAAAQARVDQFTAALRRMREDPTEAARVERIIAAVDGSTAPPRTPGMYTVVLIDVAHFGRSDSQAQQRMRNDLYKLVTRCVEYSGAKLESLPVSDTGDGLRIAMPTYRFEPARVVDMFVLGLMAGLRDYRSHTTEAYRIRLRVAFDLGLVEPHLDGWASETLVRVARLADAEPLRNALSAEPGLDLAAAVSDVLFKTTMQQGGGHLPPDCFHPIQVKLKELDTRAWLLTSLTPSQHREGAALADLGGARLMATGSDPAPESEDHAVVDEAATQPLHIDHAPGATVESRPPQQQERPDNNASVTWEEVEDRLRTSWDRHLRRFGPHHPITLTAVVTHATALISAGRAVEVEGILTSNLPHLQQQFGLEGRHYLRARRLLGMAFAQQGEHQRALHCFQEVYDTQYGLLGEAHAETLATALPLGVAHKLTGNSGEARRLFGMVRRYAPKTVGRGTDLYAQALVASLLTPLPAVVWRLSAPQATADRGLLALVDQLDKLDETVTAEDLEETVVRVVEYASL